MIKVFLVEDEKIIRKSIKNNVKWEENGFEFVGEAPDGEMALPMIEKLHPDIVITDIKMPFMDGLELSDILKKKMPKIQIIILSGYGEFDYAKEAIKIGVTDYLTKPVTGEQLLEALNKVKQKLDKKKRQEEDIKKLQKNIKTQMKNMRYQFFGNLIRGKISVSKLMEQGNELGIDLMAPAYNFMLFKIFSKNENDTEAVYDLRTKEDAIVEEVSSQFENMIVFHRVTEGYVLMIKAQNTEETIQVAKDYVAALTKRMKKEKELQWFAGIGHAVERLHNLSESYDSASKAFAYQYQSSGNEAVFFDKLDNEKIERAEDLQQVDFTKVNSESLEEFLKNGKEEAVHLFVEDYTKTLGKSNMDSFMFCQYMLINIQVGVMKFVEKMGVEKANIDRTFNFSFSEDMDYKMYRIVIGAESFDAMKPYEEIKEAKELVKELNKNAVTDESKLRTRQIGKLLDNLKISIEEIEHSDLKNDYMENNQRLRLNVNVFTEIIKEKVSEYIYYEIGNMESMRVKLEKEIMHTITITLIAVLFLSLITWKLSKLISQSISYPVRQLCEMTKEVAQGNFDVHGPQNTTEELQILTNNFEHMAQKVERLIEDVKVEQQNLRKKELQLLQEQINPHFLYNTLDTIMWLAIDHQDDKVVEMVAALSGFFRTSLSHGEDKISIREELEHVENYLKIQQLRYGDIMEYSIDVPDEIKKNDIVKITLQPLVENALYHGLKKQREKGMIKISGVDDENNIFLIVEDNGVGMQPEQVVQINKEMYEDIWVNRTTGFGIANVNRRIKLYYGEEYGLILESEPDIGTKVIVVVPKTRQVEKK